VAGAVSNVSLISIDDIRETAQAYRTEAAILPGLGHDVMLETGWRTAAERIDGWLRKSPTG